MAMNRMRSAMAAPRKGETFELRAGLVYVWTANECLADTDFVQVPVCVRKVGAYKPAVVYNMLMLHEGRSLFRRPSWQ
jgi:AP-1 complex subunit beta-1